EYTLDGEGMGNIIHDFSWPHTKFPSHVTPTVPGSILEGGELGYSLSTAYGAVLDNPNLIAAAIVGDGESETGPIAAAWHSNKFLNPKTSGAVLPIIHVNGYKISNPTLLATMSDKEATDLFNGYGYEPIIVSAPNMEKKMMDAMERAYQKIRKIQKKARSSKKAVLKPRWPMIIFRSQKGWKGVKRYKGHAIEGSFHSHGVPIPHPSKDPKALKIIEKWLKSYSFNDLVDKKGRPLPEVTEFLPKEKLRIGMNKHAIGGNMCKDIKLPALGKFAIKIGKRGSKILSSMRTGALMLGDIFKKNKDNFRLFCPDELESNKLADVFNVTKRAYMWPTSKNDEFMDPEGRVMEILSEHTLQGWMQGYNLTGRYGIFVSYEAFTPIIASMVDQYAKFLKQSFDVKWRTPVPPSIYLLSSVGWRQDHNGYSHQNPSFVSGVLQKHGEFCQIYYPSDANSLLAAYEETLQRKDSIAVIVAGKRHLPQWLSLKEAREQAKNGIAIWDWVGGKKASKDPDVVLASAGDYITKEALMAVKLCKQLIPEMKIRYVNVSELTSMCLGDYYMHPKSCNTEKKINNYFTEDKPVIFSYHGYTNDLEQILWPYVCSDRFHLHGYQEQGSTTTPFDMTMVNNVSRYHLAMDMIRKACKQNKKLMKKGEEACINLGEIMEYHQKYICEKGDDPREIVDAKW
ncbi:phosphoketolase family protein, partial [Patescibacteria group bacterium]